MKPAEVLALVAETQRHEPWMGRNNHPPGANAT